jgi:putative SOS response-associated peptidase YedK
MCGKFTRLYSWQQVFEYSNFLRPAEDPIETTTPMRFAPVIHLDASGKRTTSPMRWGFVDRRAISPVERPKHMHARSETIDTLPTFSEAFAGARGIVVVNTFNEGEELPSGKTKQWTITPRDGKPIGIAVIYERWEHTDGNEILTFVMATTPANKLISAITDRMPAILPPERWATWLGETNAPLSEVKSQLQTFEGDWDMREQEKKSPPPKKKPVPQPDLF